MAHPRAKLTEFGRQLVVDRVLILGWSGAVTALLGFTMIAIGFLRFVESR
jgi:hypothetical protein